MNGGCKLKMKRLSQNPLIRCFAFYKREPGLLAWFLLLALLVQGSGPLTQMLIGLAFDELTQGIAVVTTATGVDYSRAVWWAGILVLANLLRGGLGWVNTIIGMLLGQRLLSDLRDRILVQVQSLDMAWHRRHGTGEVVTRTTRDADKVRDALIGGFRQIVEMAIIIVASLAVLGWYHPLLVVGPVVAITGAVLIVMSQVGRLVVLDRRVGDAYDQVTQDLGEGVIGARVIKAFALEETRVRRFGVLVDGFMHEAQRALRYTVVRIPIPQMMVACAHVWVLGLGAWMVGRRMLSVGDLAAAVMVMQALVFRVEPLGRLMQVFADARSSAGRIVEMLDTPSAISDGDHMLPPGPLGLRLRGVTVNDAAGNAILGGVDLDIAAGEVVALVGATGSGKSTLAELLPRLRDPDGGTIAVIGTDGHAHDLRHLRLHELRRRVQVAFQDSFLFSTTLAENLRAAAPQADDAQLRAALHQAAAEELEGMLAKGLATVVGERGVTLSGGQRQRVCLARTLLAAPAVVCFDDATSALDAVTETAVLQRLRANAASTTVLLVASKWSTVVLADRVVVLEGGRVVASGPHAELLQTSASYRALVLAEEAAA